VRLPSAHAAAEQGAAADAGPLREQRILIVDDNEDVRETLREMLLLNGHEVHEAIDGASGIAAAKKEAPDVALIDIALPDLDGYEVARRLRARHPDRHPTIVAVTGWGPEDDRRKAREAGIDHHIVKPADIDQLQHLLAQLAH